ncbi:MAG: DUF4445 domain-containing protein [Firmicutes bacterium]|nr:DUF4445 domain-containing protein [Bacillota bacterium]
MTRHFRLTMPARGTDANTPSIQANADETVLDAMRRAGESLYAPCAGRGICGKCRIIARGELTAPTDAERDHLSPDQLAAGVRLACQARIAGDVTIQAAGPGPSDAWRDIAGSANILLRTRGFGPARSCLSEREPQRQPQPCSQLHRQPADLAVALDIGTTTLVAYLVDSNTRLIKDAAGALNPQAAHGADLISRIAFSETPGGPETLRREATHAADDLVRVLLQRSGVYGDDVRWVSAVGNTCMHHLFLGIPAGGLGRIPYAASVLDAGIMSALSAGLTSVNPEAGFFFLPNIAGFVGSDALAVALVAGMDECSRPTLAIDIGTNGEILLAANGRILACSAAAGPAFEGVNISSGMIAAQGAIDWVGFAGPPPHGDIEIHVIGNIEPHGICGSGLISLVAALRRAGLVSEAGAFEPEAIDPESPLARRIATGPGPGGIEFILSDPGDVALPHDIAPARVALTQRDIRELQLAKAAIRAGAEALIAKAGIRAADIEQIVLAGAFGTYLDTHAAQAIGLLPSAPQARITALGNAAGEGAAVAVANCDAYREARRLARIIEHVELGANPKFMQVFADSMLLA